MTDGGSLPLADALKILNQDLGTNYRHDRITAWEQGLGGRKPNVQVYEYMIKRVVPCLLEQVEQGVITRAELVEGLMLPSEASTS